MNGSVRSESGQSSGYKIPGHTGSYWLAGDGRPQFPRLQESLAKDVIVLGAGIAGLTTALLLQRAGFATAILEARKVLGGVSGQTTAKITSAHGLIYHYLASHFGADGARQYAAANQAGFDTIASLVREYNIDCDYQPRDFYLYGEQAQTVADLQQETEAAQKAGLSPTFTTEVPLPFPVAGALLYPGQAQFHPAKYLTRLLQEFVNLGGEVFEDTPALEVTEKTGECRVQTAFAPARGKNVVVAVHFPFMLNGLYYIWMNPQRSYALALKTSQPAPEAMFYQATEPFYALRSQPEADGELLIVSGGHHRTGQGGNTRKYYQALEEQARRYRAGESVAYHWSTQDNFTLDRLPYMGRLTKRFRRTFIATGFGGWGMTNGTAAALVIRDLVQGKPHPWPVLSPARRMPGRAYRELAGLNWLLVKAFVQDHLGAFRKEATAALAPGAGEVGRIGFMRLAVSKSETGEVRAVSPVCTHLGCLVRWNPAEESWDCPCHGSRFSREGKVRHGPAYTPLAPETDKLPPEV